MYLAYPANWTIGDAHTDLYRYHVFTIFDSLTTTQIHGAQGPRNSAQGEGGLPGVGGFRSFKELRLVGFEEQVVPAVDDAGTIVPFKRWKGVPHSWMVYKGKSN